MNRLLLRTLVSAGIAVIAAPALAQDATPPAVQGRQMGHPAARHAVGTPSERVEGRLEKLKAALKITDAQQPQWNAFADTLRKQARAADERMKTRRAAAEKGAQPLNAIQRLEQRQAFLAAASARTSELLASAKPLYAALSPEQQKIADDLIAKRAARGGPRHHHGHQPARG